LGHRKNEIERLKDSLADLPALATVEVSKQEAVRLLAPTIHGLQAKGYSLDRIAELVSERGVTIAPTTLKSYLQRVKPRRKAPAKTIRRQMATESEASSGDARANVKATPPARHGQADGLRAEGTKGRLGMAIAVAPDDETPAVQNADAEPKEATAAPSPVDPVALTSAHGATSPMTQTKRPVDTAKARVVPRGDSDDI
jgi:hypothetical protein